MTRSARLLALPIGAGLAIGALVYLRATTPDAPGQGIVSGTITGRYGVVWGVRVAAEAGDRLLAETWTDPNGRYSLELPAGVPLMLRALPIPYTYLIAEERSLLLEAGETRTVAFDLKTIPFTSGTIVGPALPFGVPLRAVPEGAPPGASAVRAELRDLEFRFWGLDTGAPYRPEVGGFAWALEQPMAFRGGDSGIVVRLRRILAFDVRVREVGEGNPIPVFTVKVLSPKGEVFATAEGKDGRLRWQAPHPDPAAPPAERWTLLVSAAGYFEERCAWWLDFPSIFLQRVRDPNITLVLTLEDGTPFEGELLAEGMPSPGFGGVDARARKTGPGRFAAVLPSGRWYIRLDPGPDYEGRICEATVPDRGETVVEVPPLTRRPPDR